MAIPLTELLEELNNDPTTLGYKDAGEWKSPEEIRNLLTAASTIPNPDPAPQIERPLSLREIAAVFDDTELQAIEWAAYVAIKECCMSNEREILKDYIGICFVKGWITQAHHNTIVSAVDSTIDDPNHPPTIVKLSRIQELWGAGAISIETIKQVIGA